MLPWGEEGGKAQLLCVTKGKEPRAPRSPPERGDGSRNGRGDKDASLMAETQALHFSPSSVKPAKSSVLSVNGFGRNW